MSGEPGVGQFEVSSGSAFMDAANDAQAAESAPNPSTIEAEEESTEEETSDDEVEEDEVDTDDEEAGEGEEAEESDDEDEGEAEDDDEEPEEDTDDDTEKPSKKKPKTYSVTASDGSQVKLKDDATVKIKVDGSFQRVAVSDLVSNYNGHVKYDELIRRSAEAESKASEKLDQIKVEDEMIRDSV